MRDRGTSKSKEAYQMKAKQTRRGRRGRFRTKAALPLYEMEGFQRAKVIVKHLLKLSKK